MITRGLYINGSFVDALDGATMDVINPHDGSLLAVVAEGGESDIDRAVDAAREAFPRWSSLAAADRGKLLLRLASLLEQNADELARLESIDTGHPLRDTAMLDVPRTIATFRYFGGMADKYQGFLPPVDAGFLNYVLREPIGVVGQIVPWNFPLMFCGWKLGPALAAGNTDAASGSGRRLPAHGQPSRRVATDNVAPRAGSTRTLCHAIGRASLY